LVAGRRVEPVREAPDASAARDVDVPIVFRGGASHWDGVNKWTPRFFAETFPDVGDVRSIQLPLDDIRTGTTPYSHEFAEHVKTLPFSQACLLAGPRTFREGECEDDDGSYDGGGGVNNHGNCNPTGTPASSHYVYQVRAIALLNESQYLKGVLLRHDLNFGELHAFIDRLSNTASSLPLPPFPWRPPLALARNFEDAHVWIGSNNTRSGLHFDTLDNFHTVMSGSKTVVLFPPQDAPLLYSFPDVPIHSQIDPLFPDVADAFPLVTKTRPQAVVLLPGDVLWIPRYHWHWIESNAPTVSVNWWYASQEVTPPDRTGSWWRRDDDDRNAQDLRQRRLPTESLDSFRHIDRNLEMLQHFYQGVGAPAVCRAWYSLSHGFVSFVRVLEEAGEEEQTSSAFRQNELQRQMSRLQRVGAPPTTLLGNGAKAALTALEMGAVALSAGHSNDSINPGGTCGKEDIATFRRAFRESVVRPLLRRLEHYNATAPDTQDLTEADLQRTLVMSLELFRGTAPGCLLDDLFQVRGGGSAWRHCEDVAASGARMEMEEL
jgi:hypothetical protein